MNWTKSSALSAADLAEMRADALDPERRAEFARTATLQKPQTPEACLDQLWDLLDLLNTLAGPQPANREPCRFTNSML